MNLDIKLLGKAIQCHGLDLVDKIKEEQQTEPSSSMMSYIERRRPMETEEKNEMFLDVVRSFIARKSDMLFKPLEPAEDTSKNVKQDNEEVADVYAIMPPLETFMSISSSIRRDHFYNSLSKEDCVTGVVTSVLDTGLLVRILCVDVGPSRDMDGLDVTAYCPAKELPRLYAKESSLDAFQTNDIVRGVVLSVNAETERIIVSLQDKSIPPEKASAYPRIGLITEDDFPVHYRRKSEAQSKDYEDILESVMGFNNVGNVKTLVQLQGFTEIQSFTRSLSRLNIPKMEYAEGLNKWQSQKMAHQSVALGVGMFKDGKYVEAMQHFNKALQIDGENVEALVARGALYANKENFEEAVSDFRQALSVNATHSNARNYLIETLLTMGKLKEDDRHLSEACKHYQQALEIDSDHTEAKAMLSGCQKLMAFQESSHMEGKSSEKTQGKLPTHTNSDSDSDMDTDQKLKKKSAKVESSPSILSRSTEKLLQLIKEDESKMGSSKSKKKRKHRRNTDHSSPEKEESKKKRKGRVSSREEKASSSDSDSQKRQKGKFKDGRMKSPSPGADRVSSVRIKDKASTYRESNLVTSRLQSPSGPTSVDSFLPFSSHRFFNESTIPGLGSPPPSDANLEPDRETGVNKPSEAAGSSSAGVERDVVSRPQLSRRESYLMEQRKIFYQKEEEKSPPPRRKRLGRRSSSSSQSRSSSSSSSSSSTSSSSSSSNKGRGRRGRKESSSPMERKRGRRFSTMRSRSRSHSSSQSRGSYKKDAPTNRTGVAELDMYLGERSSGKTINIMDLLGYGSKSPKKPPSDSQRSRSRSRSAVKRVKGSRGSRSPVRRRGDRSLSRSRSPGGGRQRRPDKESSAGRTRRKSPSRAGSHQSDRHKAQYGGYVKSGNRVSLDRKTDGTEESTKMSERNRQRHDGLEREREASERVKREKQGLEREGTRQNLTTVTHRQGVLQKRSNTDGSDRSSGLKIKEKEQGEPESRPFLPRVLRKPAMDDPKLATKTMSSKEYDAMIREKREKNNQRETVLESDEPSKRLKKEESLNKQPKASGGIDPKASPNQRRRQESRKDERENEVGQQDEDLYQKGYGESREKKSSEPKRKTGGVYDKTRKSDPREQGNFDAKNDPRERERRDRRSELTEREKLDGKSERREREKLDGKSELREREKHDRRSELTEREKHDRKSLSEQREREKLDGNSEQRERRKADEKDYFPAKKTILMAPEDLEKEIERRVQERLKAEEKKEKEKEEERGPAVLYMEEITGWTKDAYGKRYYAIEGKTYLAGYHKDKFGKTYYVGPNPATNELGETQRRLSKAIDSKKNIDQRANQDAWKILPSSSEEPEKDKRKSRTSVSPNKWNSGERARSRERGRNYPHHELGRPSLSRSKGSARDEDRDFAARRGREREEEMERHFPRISQYERISDSEDEDFKSGAHDSHRRKRSRDKSHDLDLPSTSSTDKEPPRRRSKWDQEDKDADENGDGNSEAKKQKMSSESLTDLEKFLSSLKQRKKQQWIAEGKIKEKE